MFQILDKSILYQNKYYALYVIYNYLLYLYLETVNAISLVHRINTMPRTIIFSVSHMFMILNRIVAVQFAKLNECKYENFHVTKLILHSFIAHFCAHHEQLPFLWYFQNVISLWPFKMFMRK